MKKKIMVLEDSLIVSKLLTSLLKTKGYEVAEFGSVGEANNMRGKIDLALLDYQLPDGTGLEVARNLRKRVPGLPMVILTARGGEVSEKEAHEAGIRAFLEKPVDSEKLIELIESFVNKTV